MQKDAVWKPGHVYTYDITIFHHGLDVQVSESINWNTGNTGSGDLTLKDHYDQTTNTYYVYTAKGLEDWVQTVRGGNLNANCILFNDIDLEGAEWTDGRR